MRQFWIGRAHRGDQRIHHLALDAIVQMAGIRDVLETAPAVRDVLVLGERIGDQRKGALIGLERLCQRFRRRLALGAVTVLQEIERRLDRELFRADLEAQTGDGLVEQPVEGGIAGLRLLQEELLELVVELVRLLLAQPWYPTGRHREPGRPQAGRGLSYFAGSRLGAACDTGSHGLGSAARLRAAPRGYIARLHFSIQAGSF